MKKIIFYIVLWACQIMNFLITKVIKHGGSNITGKIALMIQKDFISNFTNLNLNNVIMVTGTNGKTSTTNLIAYTLKTAGKSVATNNEGANMLPGVATTLIKNSTIKGKFNKEYLVLEIDERSIEKIHSKLPAKHLLVTNILKDQVQRNGDPEFILKKISNVINEDMTLYLNNEEPRSKSLENKTRKVIYYSIDKNAQSFTKEGFYEVTLPCPKCSNKIKYNYYNIENIGEFQCHVCQNKSEYAPNVKITEIDTENKTFMCQNEKYEINYTLPFYMYNYASVLAVCKNMEIETEKIKESFKTFTNPLERREHIEYKDKKIKYLRMKQENPETLQNALNTIAEDKSKKAVLIGLFEIKDFEPAYANTFYFFDCGIKPIVETDVEKYICFSRTVSYDCANRLIYEGVDRKKIDTIDSDDVELPLNMLDEIETDNIYIVTGMKPYKKIKKYFADKGGEQHE